MPRFAFLLLVMAFAAALAEDGRPVPFDSGSWNLERAKVVEHLGRQALMGTAILKDASLQDGVIDVDVAVTGARSYPGVLFRVESPGNAERIYLRPHRATLARYPDVVQYLPMFNGVDSWQLYSGDGFTSYCGVPLGQWFHVRLEVKGTQARVFVDDMQKPALTIPRLVRDPAAGGIGLMGPADGTAYFSNLSWRKDAGLAFLPQPRAWEAPGAVREWEVSAPVKAATVDGDAYPMTLNPPPSAWRKFQAEAEGRVDISRLFGRTGGGPDTVFARTVLRADQDGLRSYRFGYSDAITVFLNGRPVFAGDSSYMGRDPSFLGIVGPHDTLFLPLRKGENELLVTLSENMGGWGFLFQDAKAVFETPGIKRLWKAQGLRTPESVAYDPVRKVLYVSNYDPTRRSGSEGLQSISRVTLEGRLERPEWVRGLRNPTGIKAAGDTLWVVEPNSLVEIDIPSAAIRARHEIPEARMLNDIEVGPEGSLYVSDSAKGEVFRWSKGRREVIADGPGFARPNGLLLQGSTLWVVTNGDATLKAVELPSRKVARVVPFGTGRGDGLAADEDGNLLLTHNEGRLLRVSPAGDLTRLVDSTVPGQQLADLAYIPGLRMVVMPTFQDNGLVAYALAK